MAAAAKTTATARGAPKRERRGLIKPATTPMNTATTNTRTDPFVLNDLAKE
jgi:hypothetical protein